MGLRQTILVATGLMQGASTDGPIFLELFGRDRAVQCSGEFLLEAADGTVPPFRQGATDSFQVHADAKFFALSAFVVL